MRLLLLSFTFVVSLLTLSTCGTRTCDVSSCPFGCCDARGACQSPSPLTCGTQANACQACSPGVACQLGACIGPPVGGGGGGTATGGGGGANTGGGSNTGGGGGNGATEFKAWSLSIAGGPLPGACFRDGVGPGTNLGSLTMRALTWEVDGARFFAPSGPTSYVLGEAPVIRLPQAIAGTTADTLFSYERTVERVVNGGDYLEERETQALFQFTDFGSAPSGTLTLITQYRCTNGSGSCPARSTILDSASCRMTVTFTATSIPLGQSWFVPQTPLAGARRHLVAFDQTPVQTVAMPRCFRGNLLPVGERTIEVNARSLTVVQLVPEQTYVGTCSSANCAGCCTPAGVCEPGTTATACGVGADHCSVCPGSTGTCTLSGGCMGRSHPYVQGVSLLSLDGQSFKLGDAPTIASLASGVAGSDGHHSWRDSWEDVGQYREMRQTSGTVSFVPGSVGTLNLKSAYACFQLQSQSPCPTGDSLPSDAASCEADLNFWASTPTP